MRYSIVHDGVGYNEMTENDLVNAGVPADIIAAEKQRISAAEGKKTLRKKIAHNAGDVEALLGTTADGATLALFGVASLVKVLHETGTPETKAALEQLSGGKLLAVSESFLAQVGSGDVVLPFLVKGIENVVNDIEQRSTAVSSVLIQAFEAKQEGGA